MERLAARARVAMTVSLAVLTFGASAASAATPQWLDAVRVESGQHALNGVSCPSTSMCAGASTVPVVEDGAPPTEPSTNPDPGASAVNAVSCAPGTRFCMFVDNHGGAFSYDSGAFGSASNIDGTAAFRSVSCPTTTFCMAIDANDQVFKYSSGSWGIGLQLAKPSGFSGATQVSCSSGTSCVAVAGSTGGVKYYTWNGTSWTTVATLFDPSGGDVLSLTCTSPTFCLATDVAGNASVYNGSSWSTHAVDTLVSTPSLYSSCVGTACVAVDSQRNAFTSPNGTTWTPNDPANIQASTGIGHVRGVSCATSTLCAAVDDAGNATTYAVPPGTPSLTGTGSVGETLTLTHAAVAQPSVWYADAWRRCDGAGTSCASPISTSPASYTLTAADAGKYIDVSETVGFGFDQQADLVSSSIGPIAGGVPPNGTPPDADGDGIPDASDGCPAVSDLGQPREPRNGCPILQPTAANDTITGNTQANVLCGLGGNDTLNGLGGNDVLWGDSCNDKLKVRVTAAARDGNDTLNGGAGNDKLYGAGGNDTLNGATGNDRLFGGGGNDKLNGGPGTNTYSGGPGNDAVNARNGKKETVDCGAGKKDVATVDKRDKTKGCEKVKRAKK